MNPTFTFFAVDKGNMTLVQFPNGVNLLVDCRKSEGCKSPLEYLSMKIGRLDIVAITHPHLDHISGLAEVCEKFKPKYLWHNNRFFKPDPIYEDWSHYEELRKGNKEYCESVTIRSGKNFKIGDSNVRFCGPLIPNLEGTTDDENNNGLILVITTGKTKVVLTGDTQEEQWKTTDIEPLRDASVFLASHHGRENGFSRKAMAIINPQHIIISDGVAAETDATEKYRAIAPVSTTRDGSIVVRRKESDIYT